MKNHPEEIEPTGREERDSLLKLLTTIMEKLMAQAEDMSSIEVSDNRAAYKRVRKVLKEVMEADIPELIATLDVLFPEAMLNVPKKHISKASDAVLAKHYAKVKKMRRKPRRPQLIGGMIVTLVKDKRKKPFTDMNDIM